MIITQSGAVSVDFSPYASAEPRREDLVERKICEGYQCGRSFWRRVPPSVTMGEKVCEFCRRREAREAADTAKNPDLRYFREFGLRKAS